MPLEDHIVIYGGSFNPPHIGHQVACLWLVEALNAKSVVLTPTYQHAFGKQLLSFEHRMKMCRYLAKPFNKIIVSDIEETLPHPNTTINTVKHFLNFNSKIAVAIGSDLLPELDEWTGWDEVMKLAKVVVVGRTGAARIHHDYPVYEYPMELSAISSSQVRSQIRRDKDITGLVPKSIKKYIEKNNLYR